ncbi:MAG: winged helix-turn-helix transcriptional regulator [Methanomassiliicoccus sp.]|nr:winged helix-turn-helix transcriptional regulator [Methanomassiliicoccus sp.]
MDALDRRLLDLIERRPRSTYRSLADGLGTSVATVQRRAEGLMTSGRLGRIRGRLSLRALGCTTVMIHGPAQGKLTPEIIDGLGDHGSIRSLSLGMYGRICCLAYVRRPEEVNGLMTFLRERVGLTDARSLIVRREVSLRSGFEEDLPHDGAPIELRGMDLRIIRSLYSDGRKSIAAISKETGISAKAVKRRLEEMTERGILEFETDLRLAREGDIPFSLLVEFGTCTCRDDCLRRLAGDGSTVLGEAFLFQDVPELVLIEGSAPTLSALTGLTASLLRQDEIVQVRPDVITAFRAFDTWVDVISRGEGALPDREAARHPGSGPRDL